MGAIFYSNYKSNFLEIVRELKNQQYLKKIAEVSLSKNGIIKYDVLRKLLDKLNSTDFNSYEFENDLKKYSIKKYKRELLQIIEKQERERKNKENPEEFEEEKRKREFIPYKDRTSGYNHKNKETFEIVRNSFLYNLFFISLNTWIAIEPLFILEDTIDYFSLNKYSIIEIASIIALIDPILVFVFYGMTEFRRTLYKIE